MFNKINIWTYNEGSEGAKALSNFTGFKRIRHKGSKYKAGKGKLIINWGDSRNFPEAYNASKVLNSPKIVGAMSNKLKFFELLGDECRTVPWTRSSEEALRWQQENPNAIIVCRTVLTGHSGDGIILYNRGDGLIPKAPLYTLYVPKKDEYRIHFFNGKVIDIQQKKKRHDFEGEANYQIRNHQNGFVYCREGVDCPADVLEQATRCFNASGLDFGAIDVIFNAKQGQAYILEVNTAPGIEGTSVEKYAQAIKEYAA